MDKFGCECVYFGVGWIVLVGLLMLLFVIVNLWLCWLLLFVFGVVVGSIYMLLFVVCGECFCGVVFVIVSLFVLVLWSVVSFGGLLVVGVLME